MNLLNRIIYGVVVLIVIFLGITGVIITTILDFLIEHFLLFLVVFGVIICLVGIL